MEQWKDIAGFEGIYQVSDTGQVRSLDRVDDRGRHLKGATMTANPKVGYRMLKLCKNSKCTPVTIHRLVATAFIPNPEGKPEVNHLDGDKQNNTVTNLVWATYSENALHATASGLSPRGEKCYQAKLTARRVRSIRKHYVHGDKKYGSTALAKKYGVSLSTIYDIVQRRSWTHIA